jgi:hypothetical protein
MDDLKMHVYNNGSIYFLIGKSQSLMALTMLRVQEFYESPYEEIHRQYFTLEQYIEREIKENQEFSYFADVTGYNIPGSVVRHFFDVFAHQLNDREFELKQMIQPALDHRDPFYLIGTYEDGQEDNTVTHHEFAHAFYYLNPTYREETRKLVLDYPKYEAIETKLLDMGYSEDHVIDEAQAYLATSGRQYLKKEFPGCYCRQGVKKFESVFADEMVKTMGDMLL